MQSCAEYRKTVAGFNAVGSSVVAANGSVNNGVNYYLVAAQIMFSGATPSSTLGLVITGTTYQVILDVAGSGSINFATDIRFATFNPANNKIELIAAGGKAKNPGVATGFGGAGGGGGQYAVLPNYAPGGSPVNFQVGVTNGARGTSAAPGTGDSWFDNSASVAYAQAGGTPTSSGASATPGGNAAAVGSCTVQNGGAGGAGGHSLAGGGGGGGAGGPSGAGRNAGTGSTSFPSGGGGGGGSNNGGLGGAGSVLRGGNGGNGNGGTGGGSGGANTSGSPGSPGTDGGGGGGGSGSNTTGVTSGSGASGGTQALWDATHGPGGGGGAGGANNLSGGHTGSGGSGGLYGGGGASTGSGASGVGSPGDGAQGIIVISWTPGVPPGIAPFPFAGWHVAHQQQNEWTWRPQRNYATTITAVRTKHAVLFTVT